MPNLTVIIPAPLVSEHPVIDGKPVDRVASIDAFFVALREAVVSKFSGRHSGLQMWTSHTPEDIGILDVVAEDVPALSELASGLRADPEKWAVYIPVED